MAAAVVFFAAALVIALMGDGSHVREGLIGSAWAPILHAATGAAAVATIIALWIRRYTVARAAAALHVSLILWGWPLAQYPYIGPPDLTLSEAAAPEFTLRPVLAALAAGALVLFPSLRYLYRVFRP